VSQRDLTAREIAEKYNVDEQVARRWCRTGLFPNAYPSPIKTGKGNVWLVPESDLENFTPPRRGPKLVENPKPGTLAQRRNRAKHRKGE
jgi:hypothetical protein